MATEQDLRLKLFNTLLTTPHRDLDSIYLVHQEITGRRTRAFTCNWRPGIPPRARCAITRRCLWSAWP